MSECQFWKRDLPTATYLGSAGLGLVFYHIELPEAETTRRLNLTNCGIVKIKKGGNISVRP
jgi:hypothetical protein